MKNTNSLKLAGSVPGNTRPLRTIGIGWRPVAPCARTIESNAEDASSTLACFTLMAALMPQRMSFRPRPITTEAGPSPGPWPRSRQDPRRKTPLATPAGPRAIVPGFQRWRRERSASRSIRKQKIDFWIIWVFFAATIELFASMAVDTVRISARAGKWPDFAPREPATCDLTRNLRQSSRQLADTETAYCLWSSRCHEN